MEKLQVALTSLGQISDNLDAVAESIKAKCEELSTVVVTEDSIKSGKELLAQIRKEKKQLDDSRKDIKRQYMAPYEAFEAKAKKIIALYDQPVQIINDQLQGYEQQRVQAKTAGIHAIYKEITAEEDLASWRPIEQIWNPKWTNATYTKSQIEQDIRDAFTALHMAVETLKTLKSTYEPEGLEIIKNGGDLQTAIARMQYLQGVEDRRKAEAEQEKQAQELAKTVAPIEPEELPDIDAAFALETYIEIKIPENQIDKAREVLQAAGITYLEG